MTIQAKAPEQGYKAIGKRLIRHDGVDKVTGNARYGADIHFTNQLYGKVLRSPHAHARIKKIDTSRATAHPEVKAVITSNDLVTEGDKLIEFGEAVPIATKFLSNNVLAEDKVLYKGQAVAAVAATSPHVAEEALGLIDVEYELLPAVTNAEDAMKPDAPILHDHLKASEFLGEDAGDGPTNVANHVQHQIGDLDKGFAEADIVIEREFRLNTVHQGYIEPQSASAMWSRSGQVTVWTCSQGHFGQRDTLSTILGVPVSDIKVVPMEIGGGFGGKHRVYLEPLAAVLSKKTGVPVKLSMSRADVLEATGPTSGGYQRVKMGVTKDGRITAAEGYFLFEGGGYPGSPIGGAAGSMFSAYDIENILLDGYDVVDNKPATDAYRAPGAPNVAVSVECVVDELAEQLGMDALDFRLLNAAKEGTRRSTGIVNPPIGGVEVMEAIKSHPHYNAPLEKENQGRGIAVGYWGNGAGPACIIANVLPDGGVGLTEGAIDIGGTRTTAAQQFAEGLEIPAEDVHPQVGDTESVGYTTGAGGSSVTHKLGWAAYEAAQDTKRQLIERAATLWETTSDHVDYHDGVFQHKSDPEMSVTFKELAEQLNSLGGPVVGKANVTSGGAGGSVAAVIVDLEVDPETGKTDVIRGTAIQDAGTAIHPGYVEGQMQGGFVQGAGWALNEEYAMAEDGSMLNTSFLDYRMPTSLDMPMVEAVVVEKFNPGHPFGVRGVGEACLVPVMAAFVNAVHDAVGVRMHELPMKPTAIVEALANKNGS